MIGDYNSTKDLWIRLKSESRPVLLYGIGNGADKIFDTCSNYGIEILGVFASDGFVTKKRRQAPVFPRHDDNVLQ